MEVIKIQVKQSVETDSDPGKATITLANRKQKYSMAFPPQVTPVEITLYNYTYKNEPKEFPVFAGYLVGNKANHKEAIISAEDSLGHLADALQKSPYNFLGPNNVKDILKTVLADHEDKVIELNWKAANPKVTNVTYEPDMSYQDVLEDLRIKTGAVYYLDEFGVLQFRDPSIHEGYYNLDPYVTNPDETSSITRFANDVVVVGNAVLDPKEAHDTHASQPLIGRPTDPDLLDAAQASQEAVGILVAPVDWAFDLHTQEQVDARANLLLRFYMLHQNAETQVEVAGMAPPLMAVVGYSPFIDPHDTVDHDAELAAAQAAANGKYGKDAPILTNQIMGVVIEKEVDYSIDGFKCKLTISPGMQDMQPITDDMIDGLTEYFPIPEEPID